MRIRDFSVKARLLVLLGIVSVALAGTVAFSWYALQRSGERLAAGLKDGNTIEAAVDLSRKAQVDFKIQVQEWKDLLIRGGGRKDFDHYSSAFEASSNRVVEDLRALAPLMQQIGLRSDSVNNALAEHAALNARYRAALKLYDPADPNRTTTVDREVRGIDRDATGHIDAIVKSIHDAGDVLEKNLKATAGAERSEMVTWLMIVSGIAILVSLVLGGIIIRGVVVPLQRATAIAQRVASGDLTAHIDTGGRDETGLLMHALKQMMDALAALVAEVRVGAENVTTASTQIASGNADLSSRTEEQASSIEETAASIEELTSTVNQNADNTRRAEELALLASRTANEGGDVVSRVVETMDQIQGSSRRIAEIIGVIDSIAFQTNILALNAAVEAARAGEQGRGFAVVASEVRNLAQRSASAAREIKGLITDSVETVDGGSKLVNEAGATMQEVVSSVKRVSDIIGEIATATTEQSEGISQVNTAVTELDHVTQQNAALVEESAAASESLRQQAGRLAATVSVFKIEEHLLQSLVKPEHPPVVTGPRPAKALRSRGNAGRTPKLAARATAGAGDDADEWREF